MITAGQYITEKLCEAIAGFRKKKLSNKFWLTEDWKRKFAIECINANALLKLYEPDILLKAIKFHVEKDKWFFSLKSPSFYDTVKREAASAAKLIEAQKEQLQNFVPIERPAEVIRRKEKPKQSKFGDLDG